MASAATLSVPPRAGAKTSPSVMTAAIRASTPETGNEASADAAGPTMVYVADEVRHSQGYHDSYYGMKPRDPRLPTPLHPISNPAAANTAPAAAPNPRSPAAVAIDVNKKAIDWNLERGAAEQNVPNRTGGTRPPSPAQGNAARTTHRDATAMGEAQQSLDSVGIGGVGLSATSTPISQDLSRSRSPQGRTHQPYSMPMDVPSQQAQVAMAQQQPQQQQPAMTAANYAVRRGGPMSTPAADFIPRGILTPTTSPAAPSLTPYEAQNLAFTGGYGQIQNQMRGDVSLFGFPGANPQYYPQLAQATTQQQFFFMASDPNNYLYQQQAQAQQQQAAAQQQQQLFGQAYYPQTAYSQPQGQTPAVLQPAPQSNVGYYPRGPAGSEGFQQLPPPQHGGGGRGSGEPRGRGRGRGNGDGRSGGREINPNTSHLPKSAALQSLIDNVKVDWSLDELADHIFEFSMDHDGSRLVQRLVTDEYGAAKIFPEIAGEATMQLMTDVFGNYVIQRLFEIGSDDHRMLLAMAMKGNVLQLSLHAYGCRVVQKALQHCPPNQQRTITAELHGHVVECVRDQNGNHVIQKCIEVLPQECQFIAEAFSGELPQLASHAYGCRVMQRLFERCSNTDVVLDRIVQETLRYTDQLVNDQYGNYVIQHVLINGTPGWRHIVAMQLVSRFAQLSRTKFGSNVTEKLFEHASESDRSLVLHALIDEKDANGCCAFIFMMQDQYANYVVQKIFDRVTRPQQDMIVMAITPWIAEIKKFTFGKHIIARLEKQGVLPSSGGPQRTPPSPSLQGTHGGGQRGHPSNTYGSTNPNTPPLAPQHSGPMPVYAPSAFSGPASADYNAPQVYSHGLPPPQPQQQLQNGGSRYTAASVAFTAAGPTPTSNLHDPAIAVIGAVKDAAQGHQRSNFGTVYDQRGTSANNGNRGAGRRF